MDLTTATTYTHQDLVALIEWHIEDCAEMGLKEGEGMRSAVWYLPVGCTPKQWVAACSDLGINEGTARNRRREALASLALAEGN